MIYLSITQIDADTGIVCTAEPMRTGPAYPQIKNCDIIWCNKSTWPIATTPEGVLTQAPLFFGTCADDANINIPGVVATYTAEEYQALKTAEHQARKPYPSWIGNEETMTWEPPSPMPTGNEHWYYWDEPSVSWIGRTRVEYLP
jgi:hypothetical protein